MIKGFNVKFHYGTFLQVSNSEWNNYERISLNSPQTATEQFEKYTT